MRTRPATVKGQATAKGRATAKKSTKVCGKDEGKDLPPANETQGECKKVNPRMETAIGDLIKDEVTG
jgi:hypothetical protein